jgi:hypothetical protein
MALRFELGDYGFQKRSTFRPCGRFFYGSHMQCYRGSKRRSMGYYVDNYGAVENGTSG